MSNRLQRTAKAVLSGLERVTPLRGYLIALITALIVVHGLAPRRFTVDGTTVGLLGVLLVVVLVPLLDSASVLGTKLKFKKDLDRLQEESATAAEDQSKQPIVVSPPPPSASAEATLSGAGSLTVTGTVVSGHLSPTDRTADEIVGEILNEASRSPRVGLILLTAELERAVRIFLLATGLGRPSRARSLRDGVGRLVEVGALTESAASALRLFTWIRNEIVHGGQVTPDADILRALDAGIPLLRTILAIPRERHVVAKTDVPLYKTADAKTPLPDVRGLILDFISPGVAQVTSHIYPTTGLYEVGKEVSWEWGGRQYPEAWYRDPQSDEMKLAWNGSLEFRGRHLDEV
ncbi:MAG: hypothetical protein ACJ74U_15510 [Jatrophihabitantaceae bacterium]